MYKMAEIRAVNNNCCPTKPFTGGKITVRQLIGEMEKQRVLDITIKLPVDAYGQPIKPPIEQIIDVFAKKLEVTEVTVIPDKVIVRGEFEVKAIYVACLPSQPVHAVEKMIPFTVDIDLKGARKGMDADAEAVIEYIDYDLPGEDDNGCPCPTGPAACPIEFTVSIVLKVTAKVYADREIEIGDIGGVPNQPKG
jgi:hypothetical protein